MVNIRGKGARGEREVIELFRYCMEQVEAEISSSLPQGEWFPEYARFSTQLKRNSMQADAGGHDIVGIPGLSVEVKRAETLSIEQWWKQCERQAAKSNSMPILFYRKSRMKWQVRCYVLLPEGNRWYLGGMLGSEFIEWYACYYRTFLRGRLDGKW